MKQESKNKVWIFWCAVSQETWKSFKKTKLIFVNETVKYTISAYFDILFGITKTDLS